MGLLDLFRRPDASRDRAAIEIDLEVGVLERCPVCRTITDRQYDHRLPAAEQLAHQCFDRDDPRIAAFGGNRDDLLSRLRSVRDRFEYDCLCQEG